MTVCNSGTTGCSSGQWECDDLDCIDVNYLCDGTRDCDDESDESEANCGGGYYSL